MKLKELIENDHDYVKFERRIGFYETSCDITKTIGNYLNSEDIKTIIHNEGPYCFKDLSSQDQLVLIKLQYEGEIAELKKTVADQK